MDYVQRKSLRHKFWGLSLSEMDLVRIGTIIRDKCDEQQFEIEVRSADGQDSFRSVDPSFFASEAIPPEISVVKLSGAHKANSLTCELELNAADDSRLAELTVFGRDVTTVSGLFHELVRELERKQSARSWIAKHVDGVIFYFVLALIAALAVYSVFDLPLNLAAEHVLGFRGSALHKGLQTIGAICVVIALAGGGIMLQNRVSALFPAVEFSGRLSDPSSKRRRSVAAILALVFLPIFLNVLANFITDAIKKWTVG